MRITNSILLMLLLISISVMGSEKSKKFFITKGYGWDYIFSPSALLIQYDVTFISDDLNDDYNDILLTANGKYDEKIFAGIGLSLFYHLRYNIIEMSENSSFSLSSNPSFGFTLGYGRNNDDLGFGHVALPAFLDYNFGTQSTVSFTKNQGFSLSIGMEYLIFPLYLKYKYSYNNNYRMTENYNYKTSWAQTVIAFTYKYLKKDGNFHGISIKTGLGKKEEFINTIGENDSYRPFTISIAYLSNLKRNQIKKSNRKTKEYRNEDIKF